MLHRWFALIGISVLTTYQHHFFDVPTGAWIGWFCVWLFPDDAKPVAADLHFTRDSRRRQIAAGYFIGAVTISATAWLIHGWGLWLMWIAGALLLVSLIYGCLDAAAFQKNADGSMSMANRWLLAPYLIGVWINSRWWTRHMDTANAITPEVWVGRLPGKRAELPSGVTTMLDLCAELPCPASSAAYVAAPALDLIPLTPDQLENAAQIIARAIVYGPVLVCCALGYSRSAAAVATWCSRGLRRFGRTRREYRVGVARCGQHRGKCQYRGSQTAAQPLTKRPKPACSTCSEELMPTPASFLRLSTSLCIYRFLLQHWICGVQNG